MRTIHMIRAALFTFLMYCMVIATAAQENRTDSLKRIWNDKTQPDTSRLQAISTFTYQGYLFSMPDSAYYYAQLEYDFAKSKGLKKYMATALNLQGISLAIRGNNPEALEFLQKGAAIQEEIGDKLGMIKSLSNIGSIHLNQGNYPKALEIQQKCLSINESLGDKRGIAQALFSIGNVYFQQHNTDKALEYYQKSLIIVNELDDKTGLNALLCNIGAIYSKEGNMTKAMEYFQKSLALAESKDVKQSIANALINIGIVYQKQGNKLKALEYFQKSLAVYEGLNDKSGIALALYSMGGIYQEKGNNQIALDYCKRALLLAQSDELLVEQKDACDCLYKTYKSMGNGNKALEYFEQMTMLKDSIYNEENTKKLTRLEMQYDFDKKEAATKGEQEKKDLIAQKELQKQKLVRNGFIGGFAIVLLFAALFLNQRNKIKKGKKLSDELLLNILPEEVAEELKLTGEAEAKLINEVTVLFTDFKGFTQYSEKLTPQELVRDIHHCFSAFDKIMEMYGMEKIKTIGDAYMAAGGLPTPNKTHATDAVKAALAIAKFIEEGKAEKMAEGKPYFEIRIGIHTGQVVAGIVGVKKYSYDIWGDTVNTASRMESSGEAGKVNISGSTYELVKDEFTCLHRGKIAAKGKGEIDMYFVENK